jgi:ribosomal protein S18 acetylase RimI-like enzyme
LIRDKSIVGVVAESKNEVIGFCSGDVNTGEVMVLALLPEYEGQGFGKRWSVEHDLPNPPEIHR